MSNQVNEELYERASFIIDYYQGKLPAKMLEDDLDNNDLESLFVHVNQLEAQIAIEEFHADFPETL